LSSTTDPRADQRGQVLVLFAGAFVVILAIAALVFDLGQDLLDRRTEQNVSDAAALAGARYVHLADYTYHGRCASAPSGMPAIKAACDLASDSGYVDGQDGRIVRVDLPPIAPSTFSGLPGYVEVQIGNTRPSFFAGVLGMAIRRTGAVGVATNQSDIPLPYSLLALDPTGCATNFINGNGASVTTDGTVHVDSSCSIANGGAVSLSGTGVLAAPECDVVGGIKRSGGATANCSTTPAGVLVSGDPLANLPPPVQPSGPTPAVQSIPSGTTAPSGCPGNSPTSDAAPGSGCVFNTAGRVWRIFPGNYPGGITVQKGTVYMDPGIYWIGGGGVVVRGGGSPNSAVLVSKAPGDNSGFAPSGGVLIYNSQDPNPTIAAACATAPTGPGCYGDIFLNGGASTLRIVPYQSAPYRNMVIYMDRAAPLSATITLNGGDSNLSVSGTIYAPHTIVEMRGGASDTIAAQLLVWNFQLNGNGSSLTVNYDPDNLFHVTGVGLVQ
jgi:hypothetical protein